jgi:hypothetical protein
MTSSVPEEIAPGRALLEDFVRAALPALVGTARPPDPADAALPKVAEEPPGWNVF